MILDEDEWIKFRSNVINIKVEPRPPAYEVLNILIRMYNEGKIKIDWNNVKRIKKVKKKGLFWLRKI
ncbi:MAG: hypothetical protein ACE5J9_03595 [Methanosarcinales archaeon]